MSTGIHHDDAGISMTGRGGELLWTYVWDAPVKPYLHPVHTPSGGLLTRNAPDDHPWHHGLWFAVKYVDADNFWEEVEPFGTVRADRRPDVVADAGGQVRVVDRRDWVRPDGTTVAVRDERTLVHVPLSATAYALDMTITLTADAATTLDRTPYQGWGGYGGLALRGPSQWHDTRLLLADGTRHERIVGEPSPWCDLSGVFPDGSEGGLTIVDHPDNPRSPVPWYASTRSAVYGTEEWSNFCNAAFLFHEPLTLQPHATLTLRHRVVVHDAVPEHATIDAWAAAYAAGAP